MYMPPGWPAGVHPPGSEDFESTAVGWLLDVVPPDYRLHGVLRRYPVALATMARHHSRACVEAARQGYRTARTELAGALPPHAIDTVLAAYRKEGARLAATARAVGLVERALRGEDLTAEPAAAPRSAEPGADAAQAAETEAADGARSAADAPRPVEPKAAGGARSAEPKAAARARGAETEAADGARGAETEAEVRVPPSPSTGGKRGPRARAGAGAEANGADEVAGAGRTGAGRAGAGRARKGAEE